MAGLFTITEGDFRPSKNHLLALGHLLLEKHDKGTEQIPVEAIRRIEKIDAEKGIAVGRAIGWGVMGALVAGPFGAAAAGFLGGRKSEVTFTCELVDGRRFIGVMSAKMFGKLTAPMVLDGRYVAPGAVGAAPVAGG